MYILVHADEHCTHRNTNALGLLQGPRREALVLLFHCINKYTHFPWLRGTYTHFPLPSKLEALGVQLLLLFRVYFIIYYVGYWV